MGKAVVAEVPDADGGDGSGGQRRLVVDMGNPHLVVLVADPASVSVEEVGPRLEIGPAGRRNVEFVSTTPCSDVIAMRVWERGSGETLACGTGACAAAVAMRYWGLAGSNVRVEQPGGVADVVLREDGTILFSGPSERIAACSVELPVEVGVE
jgi:diaminopimelate epimerase